MPPMKTLLLTLALLAAVSAARADDLFPGLKTVLSDAEWKRAGLDRLTPDQLGVVDAALIRYQAALTARLRAAAPASSSHPAAAAGVPAVRDAKPGLLERFGLPTLTSDWRSLPPLKATVQKWESANRFVLDNGQVWEGLEPITYELVGREVEIQARPNNQFALLVDGANTTLRVYRVR